MPLNYDDYAKRVQDKNQLDLEIDHMHGHVERHLTKIAFEMDNLVALTPALGLKNRQLQDTNATHNVQGQK